MKLADADFAQNRIIVSHDPAPKKFKPDPLVRFTMYLIGPCLHFLHPCGSFRRQGSDLKFQPVAWDCYKKAGDNDKSHPFGSSHSCSFKFLISSLMFFGYLSLAYRNHYAPEGK
jgi:hypothetical protein